MLCNFYCMDIFDCVSTFTSIHLIELGIVNMVNLPLVCITLRKFRVSFVNAESSSCTLCEQTAEEAMTPIESTFSLDVNSKLDW